MRRLCVVLLPWLLLASATLAEDAEKPVKFKDLPAAVQKTATEQSKGATVTGYNSETENGKTYYEVETKQNGKSRDVLIDATGVVSEVEQQVDLATLPAGVRTGLQKQAAGAPISKVESVTKGAKIGYEAIIRKNGKNSEIKVDSDGNPVSGE